MPSEITSASASAASAASVFFAAEKGRTFWLLA
jgi:hypothetical protein